MNGRIIKIISNDYTVQDLEKNVYVCKSRGRFRNMNVKPLVGDYVIFDKENNYILDIKKRSNELVRPPVSNIDQGVIITSVKEPDFSSNLLDKLIAIIEFHNIKPIICFTKLDLLSSDEIKKIEDIMNYYKKIGYEVYRNDNVSEIKKIFKNKVSVFTGQSGAGKSTLLNLLDKNLALKTGEISYALGRGKHTTRHVELIPLLDGFVADTPGFSSLDFYDMGKSDIRDSFIDFNLYREECKYKDCMHDKEDHCRIKELVEEGVILPSRYENYLKFIGR